jgi:DNA-binding XRE family transcriptional regulator
MRESTADPPTSRLVSGFRLSGVLIARRGAACNQSINGAPPPFLDGRRRTGEGPVKAGAGGERRSDIRLPFITFCDKSAHGFTMRDVRKRDYRRVAEWFRDERRRAELNQEQLGSKLKLSQVIVSNIETGERRLDVVEFLELAKAVNDTPANLLSRLITYMSHSR